MASPVWLVSLIKRGLPLAKNLARLTRLPSVGRVVDRTLFDDDDIMILPQSRSLTVNRTVDPIEHQVLPTQVVEHFIRSTSHLWLMNRCICRDGGKCESFPHDLGCLFLGEAAMDINPKLGRRVSEAEALDHVERCREAGLVTLIGRNKLDSVWLHVRPGHKLLTICACCPCCCLWRILPHVNDDIAAKVTRMPGVEVTVDPAECTECGTCTEGVCFTDAISLVSGHAEISTMCRGCGRCVSVCPQHAIELRFDPDESIERSIRRVDAVVDLD